jgi:hypothetical protein
MDTMRGGHWPRCATARGPSPPKTAGESKSNHTAIQRPEIVVYVTNGCARRHAPPAASPRPGTPVAHLRAAALHPRAAADTAWHRDCRCCEWLARHTRQRLLLEHGARVARPVDAYETSRCSGLCTAQQWESLRAGRGSERVNGVEAPLKCPLTNRRCMCGPEAASQWLPSLVTSGHVLVGSECFMLCGAVVPTCCCRRLEPGASMVPCLRACTVSHQVPSNTVTLAMPSGK